MDAEKSDYEHNVFSTLTNRGQSLRFAVWRKSLDLAGQVAQACRGIEERWQEAETGSLRERIMPAGNQHVPWA
jgi:hypothetical protein